MLGNANVRIRIICILVLAVITHGATNAQSSPPITDDDYRFVRAVATFWELPEPKLVLSDAEGVFAEKSGTVAVGKQYLQTVAAISDRDVAQLTLRFTLAHELWHLRQFADDSKEGVSSDPSPMRECMADAMAANAIATLILEGREPATTPELREQLHQVANLRVVPAMLFSRFTSDPKKHGHLTEHQRGMAIFFGLSRANYDWSSSRRQNEKLPIKQLNDVAGRFVDRRTTASPKTELLAVCNHITRQEQSALNDLHIFDMPGDLEGLGTPDLFQSGYTEVRNQSNRPIQYSVIGVSGYMKKGAKPENSLPIFVDATRFAVEIPANSSLKVDTKIRFPSVTSERGEVFIWMGPLYDEALVAAKYLADEPAARNCGEMAASSAMKTPIHQALLRLGGAAAERFLPLRGDRAVAEKGLPMGSNKLSIELSGAEARALHSTDGSSFATIEFNEKTSLVEARAQFDAAVSGIRAGCAPLLAGVNIQNGTDGLPTFSIPRLTRQSQARVTIAQRGNEAKGERIRYNVLWFVRPVIELGPK